MLWKRNNKNLDLECAITFNTIFKYYKSALWVPAEIGNWELGHNFTNTHTQMHTHTKAVKSGGWTNEMVLEMVLSRAAGTIDIYIRHIKGCWFGFSSLKRNPFQNQMPALLNSKRAKSEWTSQKDAPLLSIGLISSGVYSTICPISRLP